MRWFSRKKESPDRQAFREEFQETTELLRQADEMQQIAVGHSINLVNSIFAKRYPSLSAFRAIPKPEKMQFIESLTTMEQELNAKDFHAGLGVGLFKMWLGAVVVDDEPLIETFSQELARLSRKGDLPL